MSGVDRLRAIVTTLRSPEGCPWDRAQTPATLRGALIEEAHEVVAALDAGAPEAAREELGDLLFLVTLLTRMFEERGAFDLDDVAHAAADKMERRHPHVFGDAAVAPSWEAIKAAERPAEASALDGVPVGLPALLRAHRVSGRAARIGFDWPDVTGVRAKVDEELAELDEALAEGDDDAITEELGDLLFTLVNLARHGPSNAEDALRLATTKFERRFRAVERLALADGVFVHTCDAATLERYWVRAKEIPR